MIDAIRYKDCRIAGLSYEVDRGVWKPKALVVTPNLLPPHEHHLLPLDGVTFPTRRAADAHAVAMAKRWIDDCVA